MRLISFKRSNVDLIEIFDSWLTQAKEDLTIRFLSQLKVRSYDDL